MLLTPSQIQKWSKFQLVMGTMYIFSSSYGSYGCTVVVVGNGHQNHVRRVKRHLNILENLFSSRADAAPLKDHSIREHTWQKVRNFLWVLICDVLMNSQDASDHKESPRNPTPSSNIGASTAETRCVIDNEIEDWYTRIRVRKSYRNTLAPISMIPSRTFFL